MRDSSPIAEFTERLSRLLPPGAGVLREEVGAAAREALTALLARMDLVTREEFEVQQALLERARERLAELEAQVTRLEAIADPPSAPGSEPD